MSSKARIQNYIRQNKISELFEEMMGKLVKDLPASPIHYLVNLLQDKEKKIKHITRDFDLPSKEKNIEMSSNAKLWATAPSPPVKKSTSPRDVTLYSTQESEVESKKKYDKPWLSNAKKSPSKSKAGGKLNQTAPVETSPKKTSKPEWNRKTKLSGDKSDDFVDGDDGVDLGLVYANPKIVGETQVRIRDDKEEMESELQITKGGSKEKSDDKSAMSDITNKKSSKISAKEAKRRRKEELKKLAEESKPKKGAGSRKNIARNETSDDDALEVLEDAEDLMNEGVKNPPKSGFVIAHSGKKAKEEIELVLNMSKFFDELGGMSGVNQSQIGDSKNGNKISDDDDDFESASQVTGPRRPVWEAPESEVESATSQVNSGRRSGIDIEMFDVKTTSTTEKKSKKETKPVKSKPESRPRTAPSRSSSKADLNNSQNNGRETFRVHDPKSTKSPRSRPTTPQGSTVGDGRTSRAMSHTSNHSDVMSPSKKSSKDQDKTKKQKKKYTKDETEDEPDSKPRTSSSSKH